MYTVCTMFPSDVLFCSSVIKQLQSGKDICRIELEEHEGSMKSLRSCWNRIP